MFCLKCKKADTKVVDSRDDGKVIRRRRQCLKCGFRFTTYERNELPTFRVRKRDQRIELYDRNKIYQGVAKALEKRPHKKEEIESLIDCVEEKLRSLHKDIVESREIGKLVSNQLKNFDEVAYLRFISVYKSFSSAKSFESEVKKLTSNKGKRQTGGTNATEVRG